MNVLEDIKTTISLLRNSGIIVEYLVMNPKFERSLFIDGIIPKNKSVEEVIGLPIILSEQVEKYNYVI